ncbi:glycosyltransferase [Mesorhizobium sp. LNHC221B00]|uniref:glycosyltransferase n=1 Tax=Mesorhizobium sp. LNHC221B00 TaxID=1287233 RepID=UPI0004212E82|nr:glycosyltransferase [Mesorhizobium sp. LNHC221B00]
MTSGKRLCLNMIVKNEMANLQRCLGAVADHIDCWVIGDTGSTDGTQDFVKSFFAARNLPGELHEFPFHDFEQARNAALDHAYASPLAYDYLLFDDADMELVVEDTDFRQRLDGPGYRLLQRADSGLAYWNTRLVRRDAGARYHGVTHEYLDVPGGVQELRSVWYKDHASGSNRVDKFERDARLLLEALEKDPENQRYWFYLAQSYRDAGRTAEAAVAYAKRAGMGGWDEEAWNARLQEARCLRKLGDEAGFISQALAAFNQRPQRAEPLYDLARFYREKGMNDASVLFSEAGLAIKRPEQDILFIEDHVYTTGLLEEFAIAANYAHDLVRKDRGFAACNWLALNRTIGDGQRELAWSNLFYYVQPARTVMPSFSARPVGFTAPDGYRPSNPSVTRWGNQILLLQRTVNYTLAEDNLQYDTPDGVPVHTRNFLLRLSDELAIQSASEILPPVDMPAPACDRILGFEDMRLFTWRDALWGVSCVRELTAEGWCEQVIARIDESSSCRLTDWRVLRPAGMRVHEKNWMPQVKPATAGAGGEKLQFIYLCDPTRILDDRAQTIFEQAPTISAPQFSGGSQAIAFNGGWLAIVHEARTRPGEARRYYQHRFVWFDKLNRLAKVSQPFFFNRKAVEFAAGLAWHPDAKQLLISYGVNDCESWIATVEEAEVRGLLEEVERYASNAPGQSSSKLAIRIPSAMRERAQKNAEFTNLATISKGAALVQSDSSWTPPAPAAGTELMIAGLKDRIPDMLARIQLNINLFPDNSSDEKPLVMWMHHDVNQNAVQWCHNPALVDRVTCFAFVSHWQRERYQSEFGISPSRCVVLHNATTVAQQRRIWTKGDPLRFAYTSTPFRGLSVLLDAWEQLRLNRAELHIWSSMRLYHHDDSKYQPLFARAQALEGVTYHGIAPNPELKSALRDVHFLAYPSTFEETSCLAVIDAMAAGCRVIVPALGALPETTSGFAHVYPWSSDAVEHAALFASAMAKEAENPWFDAPEMSLTQQNYCELFFDWKERVKEWTRLIEHLTDRGRNHRSLHKETESAS